MRRRNGGIAEEKRGVQIIAVTRMALIEPNDAGDVATLARTVCGRVKIHTAPRRGVTEFRS